MDRNTIRAARAGDRRARDSLGSWLYAELRAYFADSKRSERVDDLIQAALLDILAKLELAPDDPESLRKHAYSYAGMEIRESTRNRGREAARVAALHREPHTPAESPSSVLLDEQRRELVIEHAQRLRPIYRDALLHVLDGGDYKSLAILVGITQENAACRISRATAKVDRLIKADRRTGREYRTRRPHA